MAEPIAIDIDTMELPDGDLPDQKECLVTFGGRDWNFVVSLDAFKFSNYLASGTVREQQEGMQALLLSALVPGERRMWKAWGKSDEKLVPVDMPMLQALLNALIDAGARTPSEPST